MRIQLFFLPGIFLLLQSFGDRVFCDQVKNFTDKTELTATDSCENQLYKDTFFIQYGNGAGMCQGYCQHEWTFSPHCIKSIKIGQGREKIKYPDIVESSVCTKKNWEEIYALLDITKFRNLPETIGCPDCNDGGYEWIKIISNKKEQTVRFESGKPPQELSKLVEKIHELINGE